ncbi:hypothetical protein [Azospirillum sp.]|uniref:hypothetical protein n=1 Tax=Azospirillum sp. TaxID=34012 RepID=UPI002D23B1EE|nr:hypothetical protein [Azospirillum sp.]HYD65776.1 hypothetical protein [Azospirillum sp.]
MAGNDKRQSTEQTPEQTVENAQTPTHGAITGGPPTPGRAGNGMGVSTGDYTDAPPPGADQPSGNVSNVPPTPNADKAERPRRREEGLE